MASVNKVILIGNLGKDPEFKQTASGNPVASFSVATAEKYTKDGQKHEKTEWHNVVAWGKLAKLCNQYLKKGSSVYLEGRIETRSWDDKEGIKKFKTEIIVNSIQFLSGKNEQRAESVREPERAEDPLLPPINNELDLPF